MKITRLESTIIEYTPHGVKFANDYERRLKRENAFVSRKESTTSITIDAKYYFNLDDKSIEEYVDEEEL